MSTRRLILTALACGLVILLAGGIQLVRLTGSEATPLPGIGQARTVSAVRVTPVSVADTDALLVVTVDLVAAAPEAEGTAAGSGWRLLRGADLHQPLNTGGGDAQAVPCASVTVGSVVTRCVLVFDGGGSGDRLLAYALGDQTARWDLGR